VKPIGSKQEDLHLVDGWDENANSYASLAWVQQLDAHQESRVNKD